MCISWQGLEIRIIIASGQLQNKLDKESVYMWSIGGKLGGWGRQQDRSQMEFIKSIYIWRIQKKRFVVRTLWDVEITLPARFHVSDDHSRVDICDVAG